MTDSGSSDQKSKGGGPVVHDSQPVRAAPPPPPFDAVVVADGGIRRNFSPSEFFALPLAERIQYVVQKKAVFLSDGREVDSKDALGQMRKLRANLH